MPWSQSYNPFMSALKPTKFSSPLVNPFSSVIGNQQYSSNPSWRTLAGLKSAPKTIKSPATDFGINKMKYGIAGTQTPEVSTPKSPTISPPSPQPAIQKTGLSRSAVENYLKSIGRATNNFTGITSLPDGTFDISGMFDKKTGELIKMEGDVSTNTAGVTTPPALTAPNPITGLSQSEQDMMEKAKNEKINALKMESEQTMRKIEELGRTRTLGGQAFLAKIGALGRTITGAPEQSGLGELANIRNKTEAALAEERANLQSKIAAVGTEYEGKVTDRLKELNALQQTNFENAFKLAQEGRLSKAEENKLNTDYQNFNQSRLQDMLTTFGSDWMLNNSETAKNLFRNAGYGDVDIESLTKTLKEKELEAKSTGTKPEIIGSESAGWHIVNKDGTTTQLIPPVAKEKTTTQVEAENRAEFAKQNTQKAINLAKEIKSDPSLSLATGLSSIFNAVPGTPAYYLQQKVNQLVDTLASTNLDKMKGAMSDKDIIFLRNIGTALRTGLSTKDFKSELDKIINNPYQINSTTGESMGVSTYDKTPSGIGYTIIEE